ncbi:pseudouridine synthase [Corynebacterium bovis]|uniref:pseudouridine synthase n=1 Tax=Corynebacterium bovis TaxID=36808 RepID=UPI001639D93A
MNDPARRDGTPDTQRTHGPGRTTRPPHRSGHGHGTQQPRQGRPDREPGPEVQQADPAQSRTPSQVYISKAKPAKKQHVSGAGRGSTPGDGVRLQKVLAAAGVGSRRMCERLIDAGRVEVNGSVVDQQGLRIDPERDIVRVDGTRVQVNEDMVYFVLNKPRGVHSTMHDDMGRPCLGDLIGERVDAGQRLFHVGRLDAATEGLLLLTNDGELANRLMHPSYEISKTYLATVLGEVDREFITHLKKGVQLEDGVAKADYVQIVDVWQGKSLVKVELHEGRKHIVRRMLKEAGFPVQALVRTKIHTVQLGEQKPGTVRALNRSELESLHKAVGL